MTVTRDERVADRAGPSGKRTVSPRLAARPDGHPFADLAATWRGAGEGEYPTIADFAYTEEPVITPCPTAPWRTGAARLATP